MKKIFLLLVLCVSSSVHAGIIRGAVNATASSEFDSRYDIGNTIDQSGLSSNYNSGVDDFTAYLSANPTHTTIAANLEWFTQSGVQSAVATFDLGALFSIDAAALWVEEAWAPATDVSFLASTDGLNFVSLLGNISLPDNTVDYPASVFNFSAANARYFQVDFGSCGTSGCSLGEIAFSTQNSSVSVPVLVMAFLPEKCR